MLETISAVVRTSAFASILYTASIGATVALVLITPQEAALPDSLGPNQRPGFRGVTRGPKDSRQESDAGQRPEGIDRVAQSKA